MERTSNCPNCGAEIAFRWSGAIQTTCPACRSILVRHDVDLEKVGTVGDVPASMSGIQLGTEGRFKGAPFVVIGRILYRYALGHWSEWYIRFADDTGAWLSDAQAEYAVSRQVGPGFTYEATVGATAKIGSKPFTVTSITKASYAGVEGELPFEYWDKTECRFIDLKAEGDAFATIDETEAPAIAFVGEFENFGELKLRNLADVDARPAGPAPKAKGFNCPSCGAAIQVRTGDLAQNVACSACGSIIDVRDPQLAILQRHQEKTAKATPEIPMGAVGQIKGKAWQNIGFQVRGIVVEGTSYRWREYLLWNGEEGFRYLTEYDGHWNDITTAKGLPKQVVGGEQPIVEYLGTRFKHFQSAVVSTHFVLGEFPWQVRVGDVVSNDDYVAPPLMLSREKTSDEVTWSIGTYTPPERIAEAFKLDKKLKRPRGVFANQPNPTAGVGGDYAKLWGLFTLILIVLFIGRLAMARHELVTTRTYSFNPAAGDTDAKVTPVFDLKGRASNVELEIRTSLQNDWAYFNLALLPDDGGKGYDLGREISNYSGVEDGESWHEGSNVDRVRLPSIPSGRYYLRIEPEHDAPLTTFSYTVNVRRDVPRMAPFALGIFVLSVVPFFVLMRRLSFERNRWAESDHAPESKEDD